MTRFPFRFLVLAPVLVVAALLATGPSAAAPPASPAATSAASPGGTVDINAASLAELDALPGIGPALAQRIVDYRREHGPFQKVDDLLAVKGVGPKMLAKIRDRLSAGPRVAK